MKVAIQDVEALLLRALEIRGVSSDDAAFIAADYLDAELEGHRTHGLSKFLLIDTALAQRRANPQKLVQAGAVAVVDGARGLGQIVGRDASRLASRLAKAHGIGLVGIRNVSRYSRLKPYARLIACQGQAGLVANNAGPAIVAPYGSAQPILGTNPIAFGFPRAGEPLVIDFSCGQRVWGEVRQALLEDSPLPPDAFLDGAGNLTIDPEHAHAVKSFGGPKGSALCLAIELLAGMITGSSMGLAVTDEYELGAIFVAIELLAPHSDSNIDRDTAVANLVTSIQSAQPREAAVAVRIPGDRATLARLEALDNGHVEVHDGVIELLRRMARGSKGLDANRLTN